MTNTWVSNLKQKLDEIDLRLRPHALVVNPDDSETILKAIPDIGTKVLFISSTMAPKNKIYLIDRLALGDYTQTEA